MKRTYITAVIALIVEGAAASCKQVTEKRPASQEVLPVGSTSVAAGTFGQDVPTESVWPPPADALRSSETILSKPIVLGTGTETPFANKHYVLAIGYVTYDKTGRAKKYVPTMVQAIDLAPRAWREVLLQMRRGEVRRAWITMPDGTTTIMDFEMRSMSRIMPDGSAVNVE